MSETKPPAPEAAQERTMAAKLTGGGCNYCGAKEGGSHESWCNRQPLYVGQLPDAPPEVTNRRQIGWQYTGDMTGPKKPLYRQEASAAGCPKCGQQLIEMNNRRGCPTCGERLEVAGQPNPFTQSADDNTRAAFTSLRQRLAALPELPAESFNWRMMIELPNILAALDELETAKARLAELEAPKSIGEIAQSEMLDRLVEAVGLLRRAEYWSMSSKVEAEIKEFLSRFPQQEMR